MDQAKCSKMPKSMALRAVAESSSKSEPGVGAANSAAGTEVPARGPVEARAPEVFSPEVFSTNSKDPAEGLGEEERAREIQMLSPANRSESSSVGSPLSLIHGIL